MKIEKTNILGLYSIELEKFLDERGFFMKIYNQDFYKKNGILADFVEVNQSCSKKNVIRGLHFQWDPPLGKLMRVISGRAFVAAVDIRKKSKTFGLWFSVELSEENHKLLYGEPGMAMGFLSLEENTVVEYHYTAPHNSNGESVILWNDSEICIPWPILEKPIISKRDRSAQSLKFWLKSPQSEFLK